MPNEARTDQALDETCVVKTPFRKSELVDLLGSQDEGVNTGFLWAQVGGGNLQQALEKILPIIRDRLMIPLVKGLDALGYRQATLVPMGQLSLLPLHAAVLQELVCGYVPSSRILAQAKKAATQGEPLAERALSGFADTQVGSASLPFARVELEQISRLWSGSVQPFYGPHATLARAECALARSDVCHLACHGRFDLGDYLRSGLQLSDGFLTLASLLNRPSAQGPRLVMLSACETSLPEFGQTPDETLGLPVGFMAAGATAVGQHPVAGR